MKNFTITFYLCKLMKEEIRTLLANPVQLEKLYRANKSAFKRAFNALYPEIKDNVIAGYWNERLNYSSDISWGARSDLIVVLTAALLAGLIAKLPVVFMIDADFFYQRNSGFIVFPLLTAYFAWKNRLSMRKGAFAAGAILLGLAFINFLPDVPQSDTLMLACLHLPLFLWSVLGFAFVGEPKNTAKRLDFLMYNGDLVVMTTLILIAGAGMSGITIGLFALIGFHIETVYFEYVGVFGLAAAPIVGTYLTHTNPQLVGKVAPVIAKIFSPLVLVMLLVYLVAIGYSGKDPYNDREFLLVFNALLIGVMAIIFFSIAEMTRATTRRVEIWMLLLLAVATILVNGIALSAILFRISTWGITPNRAAVLGSNGLMLVNLVLVTVQLFRVLSNKTGVAGIGKSIAGYLPIYGIWAFIVTFLFPLLFGFR